MNQFKMAPPQTSFHIVNETCKKTNTGVKRLHPVCAPPKIVIKNLSGRRNADVKQRTRLARAGKYLSNLPRVHGHNSKLPQGRLVNPDNKNQQLLSDGPEHAVFSVDVEEPDSAASPDERASLLDTDGHHSECSHDGDSGISDGDDEQISPMPEVPPKLVTYSQSQSSALRVADLALFSANVNQLRNLLDSSNTLPYYYFNGTLIVLSIILQIAVGVSIVVVNTFYKFVTKDVRKAGIINDMTVVAVYLITILNVFITSFGVATSFNSAGPLNDDI